MLKRMASWMLALAFVLAGGNHFLNTDFYLSIMPPYLPAHGFLVLLSGVLEILGGVGLLIPASRRLAGIGLIILMVAVFPANVHMAMNPQDFPQFSEAGLYWRLPLQLLLVGWAWWVAVSPPGEQAQQRAGG